MGDVRALRDWIGRRNLTAGVGLELELELEPKLELKSQCSKSWSVRARRGLGDRETGNCIASQIVFKLEFKLEILWLDYSLALVWVSSHLGVLIRRFT